MGGPRRNIDRTVLQRLVVDEGRSLAEAARLLSANPTTIYRAARRYNIKSGHETVKRGELHDGAWLAAQFDAGRSIADVAESLGVNYGTVVTARRRHGIAPRRAPKRTIDAAEVQRLLDAGASLSEIGRMLGHTSSAISKAVRRFGLR